MTIRFPTTLLADHTMYQTPRALRGVSAVMLALVAAACVRTRVTPFDPTAARNPRTPADEIRFYDTTRPTCEYREVGRITSQAGFLGTWGRVVRRARERAREMGGDAIVGVRESTRISGAVINPPAVSTTERTSISGTVIRFVDPACRS